VSTPRPLFWHQGLFLQPQHFQQSDLYQKSTLKPLLAYAHPHLWGVANLQVQEAGLGNKTFEVVAGEFIFQDGTYVMFPGNAILSPRSFDEAWVEADKPLTVYLGLRKVSAVENNVTVVDSLDNPGEPETRFVTSASPQETPDLHAGGPTAQVKYLHYVLRIFWETEKDSLDNFHLIPLAKLERSGGEIRLSPQYVPPCPTVAASEWMTTVIKDIRDQVISRCRQLEEYKRPQEMVSMEMDTSFMVILMALRSMNRYVQPLYQLTETKHVHPWAVYGLLRQIVGELSTFSEHYGATGETTDGSRALPAYDHLDLWNCFSSVHRLIAELLDGITVRPGRMIRLDFDGSAFTAELPEQIFKPRNRYWLSLRTEADTETVVQAVAHLAKLGAGKSLSSLIARALTGLPLEHSATPPPGLPRRTGASYFRIDTTSTLWAEVEETGNIAFSWDGAPDDLVVELIVLGG
jgi:type VI secretion system protein ImpJ